MKNVPVKVSNGLPAGCQPMSIVRNIQRGEKISDIVNGGKGINLPNGMNMRLYN